MKWTELNSYGEYRNLVTACEKKLEDLEEERRDHTMKDTVSGSEREYPYVKRVIKIEGLDEAELERLQKEELRLKGVLLQTREKLRRIEKWISGVRDPYIRLILERRILEGKSWTETSVAITEGRVSGDCLRMQMSKYVRKHPRG